MTTTTPVHYQRDNSATVEIKGQIDPNNSVADIDRAVTIRRIYPDGNTAGQPNATWSYVMPGTQIFNGSNFPCTEVTAREGGAADSGQRLISVTYFLPSGRYISGGSRNGVEVHVACTGYRLWLHRYLEWRVLRHVIVSGNVLSDERDLDLNQRTPVVWSTSDYRTAGKLTTVSTKHVVISTMAASPRPRYSMITSITFVPRLMSPKSKSTLSIKLLKRRYQ